MWFSANQSEALKYTSLNERYTHIHTDTHKHSECWSVQFSFFCKKRRNLRRITEHGRKQSVVKKGECSCNALESDALKYKCMCVREREIEGFN
jgi:hypothetical protein